VQTCSRARIGPDGDAGPEPGVELVSAMGYERWPRSRESSTSAWRSAAWTTASTCGLHLLELLDNFEWAPGYAPGFGLVAVDRRTFVRTIAPSGHWFAQVARANRLP
jgi:hypothetical protein